MKVWLVDEIDLDGDRETLVVCISEEIARAYIDARHRGNREFYRQYGFEPKSQYEAYPMDVLDTLD